MALKSMIMPLLINTVFEELKYFCFIIVLTKTYTNVMYDAYYTAKNGLNRCKQMYLHKYNYTSNNW